MPSTNLTKLSSTARASKHRVHFPSSKSLFFHYKKSVVPEGGWTNENFVGQDRYDLRHDMQMIRKSVILKGLRNLTPSLTELLVSHVNRVVDSAMNAFSRLYGIPVKNFTKDTVEFTVPNEAGMWADAIENELERAGLEIVSVMTPPIQSVVADSFEKVNLLLGKKPTQAQINSLGSRARDIARQVSNINNTTKARLQTTVANAIREGKTVFETAESIRKRIPQIASNRVPTIVRTELGKSADRAVGYAMESSEAVTHFDVIGCEGVEPNIPQLNGIPTCNIRGVPIRFQSVISFHPNHTGAIVAGAFRKEDGSTPDVSTQEGVGEGAPEGG